MNTTRRGPPRWSVKTDQLVRHVALGCPPGLQSELGRWLESSSRFRDFISTNQDKVRKKLSTPDDEDSRLDVRAELLVAYLVLADRRFDVSFEAYGARRLGPDLTAIYRTNQRFNVEVTRVRVTAAGEPGPGVARLANIIAGKLRQLPGDVPNALVIVGRGLLLTEERIAAATRLLKLHSDHKDDSFFARRGFKDARDFYGQYLHLSGIFILDEAATTARPIFCANREARHPVPGEAVRGLISCMTSSLQTRA